MGLKQFCYQLQMMLKGICLFLAILSRFVEFTSVKTHTRTHTQTVLKTIPMCLCAYQLSLEHDVAAQRLGFLTDNADCRPCIVSPLKIAARIQLLSSYRCVRLCVFHMVSKAS